MLQEIFHSARVIALTMSVCGFAYTSLTLTSALLVAPQKRLGSLVYNQQDIPIGSLLIAQNFTRSEYLWPRPSAVDYNAAAAGGSNLSPTNVKIRERSEEILRRFKLTSETKMPADLVTTSGSGLDPHITLEAALLQAERIAKARQVETTAIQTKLHTFAQQQKQKRLDMNDLINVLEFNLLLDNELKWVEPK